MTLKSSLITSLLIVTFFSCSSESTNNDEQPQDNNLLLKQRITDNGNGDILTETFSYDGNKLISIIDNEGTKYEYLYENNVLNRINLSGPNGIITEYTTLEYNSNNQLISYTVYMTFGNEGLRFDLTYNSDGTITVKEYLGDHNVQNSLIGDDIITIANGQRISESSQIENFQSTYEYDSNNSIYKNISNIDILNLIDIDFNGYIDSKNNNLLRWIENDNGTTYIFEEYTYTYNSSNYPETAVYQNQGDTETIQFIYE